MEKKSDRNKSRINLNTASDEELKRILKSDQLIQTIKEKRPFHNLEDLWEIPGINRELFDELRKIVYLSGGEAEGKEGISSTLPASGPIVDPELSEEMGTDHPGKTGRDTQFESER
ncbi:MAG TPA: helix-hairpin-helix domain-containing protein [Candidatus Limnocylindrales bacterium]|nr:helix-hairpin-helix domain-containing protein [Candidatus Limnocylindrales bacterium]